MKGWLLDTNVISELRKPRAAPQVVDFVSSQPGELLFVSEITFAEIRFGIEQLDDPSRRADLNLWLDSTIRPMFVGRTLPVTEDVIVRWKMMVVAGQRRGHTFGQPDLFIAASAALADVVIVSRDTNEFAEAGVPAYDPWTGSVCVGKNARSVAIPATLTSVHKEIAILRRR